MGDCTEFFDNNHERQKSRHRRKSSRRSRRSQSRRSDSADDMYRRPAASETSNPRRPQASVPDWPFTIDFALRTLAFAAAFTFGICAPLSIYLSAKWNEEDDRFQSELLSNLSALWSLDTRLMHLERFGALLYCDGKAEQLAVCGQLTAGLDRAGLVSSVGSLSTSFAGTIVTATTAGESLITTAGLSQTVTANSSPSAMGSPPPPDIEWHGLSLGQGVAVACLVIFFSVLACGFFVYRWWLRRLARQSNTRVQRASEEDALAP